MSASPGSALHALRPSRGEVHDGEPDDQSVHQAGRRLIDYTSGPSEQAAHDMDVVFDTIGGDTFQRALQTLRKGGFMVTVVAFPDGEAERHGLRVVRSLTRPSAQILTAIKDMVVAGQMRPHIETVLPLAEVRQALAL